MAGVLTATQMAALAAMVAGSYMQYQANVDAADRQQSAIRQSLDRQAELQKQAEKKAVDTAAKFAPGDRIKEQAALEQQITQDLIKPVNESQAIRSEQATTQGDVSGDYSTAKATATANSLKSAEALARLLGKTTSANRLRMNEGIRLMDTGQQIDQLNSFSRGQQAADQIGIQVAGRPDAEQVFMGSLLQAGGSAGMMYGGGGTTAVSPAEVNAANASADPIASLNAQKGWTGTNNNSWLSAFKK